VDNEERVNYLLDQINNGQATAMECEELWQLIANDPSGSLLEKVNRFFNENAASSAPATPTVYWQQAIRRILAVDTMQQEQNGQGTASVIPVRRGHFLKTARYWYAAAVMIMLGTVAYFWLAHKKNTTTSAAVVTIPDVAPGHDGAILTLADGTKMVLDSMGNGNIANQHGVQVVLKDGQLTYDATGTSSDRIFYNTMSTPNGRQFHVQLPDGTHVWLNSASSIRYPTVFAGNERKVEITGEVYFEVAKDAAAPFVVNVNNQADIQVLGTHFNVKAYDDEEAIKTTLLEGKVKVMNRMVNRESAFDKTSAYKSVVLKPGEQVSVSHSSQLSRPIQVQIDEVMAWKNGLFNFNGYDLKSAMREIARWYNLEVIYEEEPEARELMGKIQRNLTLNQVMNIIRDIDVHYRLEGRRLIIMK
jgi:transmembrane sensor